MDHLLLWGSVPILTLRAEMRGGLGLVKFGWEGRRVRARAREDQRKKKERKKK